MAATDAGEQKRNYVTAGAMDAPESLSGKRNPSMVNAADNSDELHRNRGKRCRAGDPHLASEVGKKVAQESAQWRNAEL